jgi:hypothetical protein
VLLVDQAWLPRPLQAVAELTESLVQQILVVAVATVPTVDLELLLLGI